MAWQQKQLQEEVSSENSIRAAEASVLATLKKAGVFAESMADVDPYNAVMAAKMVLDDIDGFMDINIRLIAAFDSGDTDELDGCLNELRAATLNQKLQRSAAITRSYSSN